MPLNMDYLKHTIPKLYEELTGEKHEKGTINITIDGNYTGINLPAPKGNGTKKRKCWIPTTDWYEDEGIEYHDGWICPECGEWWDKENGNPPQRCPDQDCGIELDFVAED